jgi:uncharacterized protein
MPLQTNLAIIAELAAEREEENYGFRSFLKHSDNGQVDDMVYSLNNSIAPQIDCTQCGNCCKSLMISIAPHEETFFSKYFNLPQTKATDKYLSKGISGGTIMSNMPCIFLADNKCTVYENRFTDCREFPHLHKPNFSSRFFGMIFYYGKCPIVFNVVEALKTKMHFGQ